MLEEVYLSAKMIEASEKGIHPSKVAVVDHPWYVILFIHIGLRQLVIGSFVTPKQC
jgi:hypothetical protein